MNLPNELFPGNTSFKGQKLYYESQISSKCLLPGLEKFFQERNKDATIKLNAINILIKEFGEDPKQVLSEPIRQEYGKHYIALCASSSGPEYNWYEEVKWDKMYYETYFSSCMRNAKWQLQNGVLHYRGVWKDEWIDHDLNHKSDCGE